MRQRGFTLIEAALVILIGGIILSGVLGVLQASITTRMNSILSESVELTKTSIVLSAVNSKTTATACVAGSCSGLISTLECATTIATAPCRIYVSTYPIPATISTQNDAWGNPLIYTRVLPTVSNTTTPTDTVFKVVSKGSDATQGTEDDVTYTVTASEFLSRVSRTGF
jgi:prepilin-type N-terminal cleavage/methylation domain-containing protein